MVKVFNQGDKEYFEWMENNPEGYILNTGRGNNDTYFFLHKSNCSHITQWDGFDDKAYTMRDWIKIASNDVIEIVRYCTENKTKFTGNIKICSTCKPDYIEDLISYPDDIDESEDYVEGTKKPVLVNAYERNPKARKKCIEHYGYRCHCCGIMLEEVYGKIGKEYIHVHHLKSLADIGEEYKINPIEDLIPLCPNCHSMIHKGDPVFSLEELKEMIHRN